MKTIFDQDTIKVSWTKYDIVHALDIFESIKTLETYYAKDAPFNESILKAVIGISSFDTPIPEFWYSLITELNNKEKQFLLFFSFLFTNTRVLKSFAEYIDGPFKGTYYVESDKESTNIRSLLVESGLASATYRRKKEVPFDGSILLNSPKAGLLFRAYIQNLIKLHSKFYDDSDFLEICRTNNFHRYLGLPFDRFVTWIEGGSLIPRTCNTIQFEEFLCFNGYNILEFNNSKEIYFVGENGDGKSLLLILIYLAYNGAQLEDRYDAKYIGEAISWLKKCPDNLKGTDDLGQAYTLESAPLFKNFYAYGAHRGLYTSGNDNALEPYGFMTLFNHNLKLKNPIDWLKDLYFKDLNNKSSNIDNSFKKITKIISELLENKVEIRITNSELNFYEKDYPLELDDLSEGNRGIIIMACDLFARLMENNEYTPNIFDTSGVVIIDEICQHIHPRWQREIVGKLRKIFKNMQFIVTTHSPFVIQGASNEALIYRVYRENGLAYISDSYRVSEMQDMMLNTLATSSIFGVDSAAMENAEDIDTSASFIDSRINHAINRRINILRKEGKNFISQSQIDTIINELLEEDSTNDKD